jgi:hypothetical protein
MMAGENFPLMGKTSQILALDRVMTMSPYMFVLCSRVISLQIYGVCFAFPQAACGQIYLLLPLSNGPQSYE